MADGSIGVLSAATTCAAAGIIVGIVTLTGLGLKFSSIVIDLAGGSLLLTAIYTSLVVWIIGLAVPVTASYIICAVIAAPALTKLGVPDFAAHMRAVGFRKRIGDGGRHRRHRSGVVPEMRIVPGLVTGELRGVDDNSVAPWPRRQELVHP